MYVLLPGSFASQQLCYSAPFGAILMRFCSCSPRGFLRMNYLAHGYRFVDNPLFTAGTAVPDWLCVVDRRVRVRSRRLQAELPNTEGQSRDLVNGMLQHLGDDDVFHRSTSFMILESEIGSRFRFLLPDPYDHRPGFLGHIVTELLLDSFIAGHSPRILDEYYRSLNYVDPQQIQTVVNAMATRTTDQLALFVDRFRDVRFLYDYMDDYKLLSRLNQVLRRVTLPQLDEQCVSVLRDARSLLEKYGADLLAAVESVDHQD